MSKVIQIILVIYLVSITVLNIRSFVIIWRENPKHFQLGGDSGRYIKGAQRLLAGKNLDYSQQSYIGYLGLVAFALVLNIGNSGVVLIQSLIYIFSACCTYYFINKYLNNRIVASIAALLFLTSFEILKWSTYILPDAFYTCALLIFSLVSVFTPNSVRKVFFSFILALICALIRPNGFIVLIGWILFVLLPNIKNSRFWILGFSALIITFILVTNLATNAQKRQIYEFSRNGEVIWSYRELILSVPEPVHPIKSPLDLIEYTFSHPIVFMRLAILKIVVETFRIRPYLPANFNLFLLIYLLPIYYLALRGWTNHLCHLRNSILIFLILSHLIFVGLTYSDWDGRFLVHVLPLIFIYTAVGVAHYLQPVRPVNKLH